jgi:hypothetical protein
MQPSEATAGDRAEQDPGVDLTGFRGTIERSASLLSGDPASVSLRSTTSAGSKNWTLVELHDAVTEFEAAMRRAGKSENTVTTHGDRARRFLRWLAVMFRDVVAV